jgi:hypothetical protein
MIQFLKITDILKRRLKFFGMNIYSKIKSFFGVKNVTYYEDPEKDFE